MIKVNNLNGFEFPSVKSPLSEGVVVDTALTVPVQVEPDSPDSILNTPLGVEYFHNFV